MRMKSNLSFLKSLHVVVRTPMWAQMAAGLEKELQEIHRLLQETREDAPLRQLQGKAQFITEFLDIANSTQVLIEKLETTTSQTKQPSHLF